MKYLSLFFAIILSFAALFIIGKEIAIPTPTKKFADIEFHWDTPTAMAVFERGKYIWVIFDDFQEIDTAEIKRKSAPFISEITKIPNARYIILRLKPIDNTNIVVRKDNNTWLLTLTSQPLPFKINNYSISITTSEVSIAELHNNNAINFVDPDIGDNLTIIPEQGYGRGNNSKYKFPAFTLLTSYQGIAIVKNTDNIIVAETPYGLTIKAHTGDLYISPNLLSLKQQKIIENFADQSTENTFADEDFITQEHKFIVNIMNSPDIYKNQARLKLAEYYIFKELNTNAIHVLEYVLKTSEYDIERHEAHRLLKIATETEATTNE